MSQLNDDYRIARLSIFLITGVCAGFPALLWALSVLYHHHKTGGRISFIVIFLLLSDLLELILNTAFVAYILKNNDAACIVLNTLLFGVRLCGHLLHQLVALECILTQKYPSLAVFFSPACSVPLCIIVWLVALGFQFIQSQIIYKIIMCSCVLPVIVCVVTSIGICKAPPDTNQPTDDNTRMLVLGVSMFNLSILYVPFFFFSSLPYMFDCLISMRLISEPLLCVLTCRENQLVQTVAAQHMQNIVK